MMIQRVMSMASISKRRDGWLVRVSITDPVTGKSKNVSKQVNGTKRDAERVGREMEENKDKGLLKPGKPQTVAEYSQLWLTAIHPTVSYNTYRGYEVNVRKHINPYIGRIRLKDLTPTRVRAFLAQLSEVYAPRTVQFARITLHNMLEHALDDGLVVHNVVTRVKSPKLERRSKTVLDEAQMRQLIEASVKTRLYPVIALGGFCGLRRGEIAGLRWQDVDLNRGQLSVNQTIQRHTGKGLVVQSPKSVGSKRAVAIPPSAVELLKKWKVDQVKERLVAGSDWEGADWVITTMHGSPMDPGEVSTAVTNFIKGLGLPHVTLHGLRHTFATLSLLAGVDVKRVQASLGHATAAFTLDVYGHVTASGLRDAAAKLDQAIWGK
jgi:integrase